MIFVVLVVVALITLHLYSRCKLSKFFKAGVNHLPALPFIGNTGRFILRMQNIIYTKEELYMSYPDDSFVGFYEMTNPILILKDIELLKRIAVKDFDRFSDRRSFTDELNDPLFRRNLLLLKGEEWKAMRCTLSPVFTSCKLRLMVPVMAEVARKMVAKLKNKIGFEANFLDIDCKDLCSRYANDVIASCLFSIETESTKEGDQLYKYCKEILEFDLIIILKALVFRTCPKFCKILKISTASKETSDFFKGLLLRTIKHRKELNMYKNDIIQILIEAGKNWDIDDLIAQGIIFFFAGFETISTALMFTLYELAVHVDVQDRLVREIKENLVNIDGEIKAMMDYGTIQRMKYLDMVISEVLRLWPPAPTADRVCVEDYNLGKPNSKATTNYIIHKGEALEIPIWSIHRDPKFYPEPEKFDPERFSDDNKGKIRPYTYLPFGIGPRNCMGSRFALYALKAGICQLLLHFIVSTCGKTPVSAKLRSDSIRVKLEEGHCIKMKIRNE